MKKYVSYSIFSIEQAPVAFVEKKFGSDNARLARLKVTEMQQRALSIT